MNEVTVVVKERSDSVGDCGHNVGLEKRIQTGKQERADNNGNEDFHAGIDIALCLFAFKCAFRFACKGIGLAGCVLEPAFDSLNH